jgi:hypothetical protein
MYTVHCTALPGVHDRLARRFTTPPGDLSDEPPSRRSIPYFYPTKDEALAGAARLLASGREVRSVVGPDEFHLSGEALRSELPAAPITPAG